MKMRVKHAVTGRTGTVIRDNDNPIVQWDDDGTRTAEKWSDLIELQQ